VHELSLVAELVELVERHAAGRTVKTVRARCAGVAGAEDLRFAFAQLSRDALPGAALEIESEPAHLACACGFSGDIEPASAAGHLGVCPGCGRVQEIPSCFELVGIVLDGIVLDGIVLDGIVLDGSVLDGSALDGSALDGSALDRDRWPAGRRGGDSTDLAPS
jgi:Zn finger protein HypA/HybF involved in hydrogenase expression